MIVDAQVLIRGTQEAVWAAMTDIGNAPKIIRGIQGIEILERPPQGLVGLRWRETRLLFGKPATAEKTIIEAAEKASYKTRAEDLGFIFLATMRIAEGEGGVILSSSHASLPRTLKAKLQAIPMGLFFKGVVKKALLQDLNDIKAAVERG